MASAPKIPEKFLCKFMEEGVRQLTSVVILWVNQKELKADMLRLLNDLSSWKVP